MQMRPIFADSVTICNTQTMKDTVFCITYVHCALTACEKGGLMLGGGPPIGGGGPCMCAGGGAAPNGPPGGGIMFPGGGGICIGG